VQLEGNPPATGSYEGTIGITGGAVDVHVPYLYLSGPGSPFNIYPVINGNFTPVVNDQQWLVAFKVIDQFGIPVSGLGVNLTTNSGGNIGDFDNQTDKLGIAGGFVNVGASPGDQVFTGSAGGLSTDFFAFARPMPTISRVVNGASFETGNGLAPGSYITIFGSALSPATQGLSTNYLPLAMSNVSVSFDAPGISVPGRLSFVSDQQINVQVPWELQGASSAQIKVSIGDVSSSLATIQLNGYSPAPFEYNDAASGKAIAIAQDANYALISASNPAKRGQTIVLYMNGLGPVDNRPPSGEASPSVEPLARSRVVPAVTVGGRPAQVTFSGLAPFFVGLYQLNVVIPADAPTGVQPLGISVNGVNARMSNLPIQ
jgi:uncharacterized protein (TIGR03437 family)